MKLSKFTLMDRYEDTIVFYNTLSNAVVEVTIEIGELIINQNFNKIDKFVLYHLFRRGIIVRKNRDEIANLLNLHKRFFDSDKYLNVTLVPTFMCNFNCQYCFEHKYKMQRKVIDFDILNKYANVNFKGINRLDLTLFGGEPLIVSTKLLSWAQYVKRLCIDRQIQLNIKMATNGYLLSQKIANQLLDLELRSVQITVEQSVEDYETLKQNKDIKAFDRVMYNIAQFVRLIEAQSASTRIILRINLLNSSTDGPKKVLSYIDRNFRKYIYVYFTPVYSTEKFFSCINFDLSPFYELASNLGFKIVDSKKNLLSHCNYDMGKCSYHILPDLSLKRCVGENNSDVVGHIEENGMVIFDNTDWGDGCSWKNDKKCLQCPLLPKCWGGCPLSFKLTGIRKCIEL